MIRMDSIILAGGRGLRVAELSHDKPKPMIEVGGKPILAHIVDHIRHYIEGNIYIATGYLHEVIEAYPWPEGVIPVFTGEPEVDTWLRLLTVDEKHNISQDVLVSYGDCLTDAHLGEMVQAYFNTKYTVPIIRGILLGVHPPARWGYLGTYPGCPSVLSFNEKPQETGYINGGRMVLHRSVFASDYWQKVNCSLEKRVLPILSSPGAGGVSKLLLHRHEGFWLPMDTLHEQRELERIWATDDCPWRMK